MRLNQRNEYDEYTLIEYDIRLTYMCAIRRSVLAVTVHRTHHRSLSQLLQNYLNVYLDVRCISHPYINIFFVRLLLFPCFFFNISVGQHVLNKSAFHYLPDHISIFIKWNLFSLFFIIFFILMEQNALLYTRIRIES